jgi:aromatic ring-opening dioxygenase catalytic subunit (LigB family)
MRMPVVFIPHGGGPWPFVDLGLPRAPQEALAAYLRTVPSLPKERPRALVVVSAHWEAAVPTVQSGAHPPLLFDYYGFPPAAYRLAWPAPGDPALAARVRRLLDGAGFESAEDAARGYDHGTFVPLMVAYPDADVPAVQLSLVAGLDPATHLRMGRALAPLRDEGVFIVGSGMTFHNMAGFRGGHSMAAAAETFDAWLRETMALDPQARDRRLCEWAAAPMARAAHPREEHLAPLFVAAGAAGEDRARHAFGGSFGGMALSAFDFGAG